MELHFLHYDTGWTLCAPYELVNWALRFSAKAVIPVYIIVSNRIFETAKAGKRTFFLILCSKQAMEYPSLKPQTLRKVQFIS